MISYLAQYSWDEGARSGLRRAFISFDFPPTSKHIMEAEKQMEASQGQKILILTLTKIASEDSK
ncbi:hypothetical protein D3C76_260100 [compost metagenome]